MSPLGIAKCHDQDGRLLERLIEAGSSDTLAALCRRRKTRIVTMLEVRNNEEVE
jgi:hypothetical protein